MSRVTSLAWLLAIAWAVQPALAQTLYKSIMPDGRVIYGDKPVPGAAKVEAPKTDTSSKGIVPPTPKETAVLQQLEGGRMQRDYQDQALRAAEAALRDAEAKLAGGKEPLPDERIGTAGGASRLNDAYWARQKSLEKAVEDARANLDRMRAGK